MRQIRAWIKRLAGTFGGRRDGDAAAELESHLQFHVDDNLRAGMTPEEARRQALIKLGGLEQTKAAIREQGRFGWVDSLVQDVRFALRMLGKNPGFTVVAILTLALGIGANAAIFSAIDAVLLRPLPYEHSDRLLFLVGSSLDTGNFAEWHSQSRSYDRFAALSLGGAVSRVGSENVRLGTVEVSPDFFPLLDIQPALGRPFIQSDFQEANGTVAIMSDRLWRTSFHSDPKIVGRVLLLDELPVRIVGVLPAHPGPLPYRNFDLLLPLRPERAKGTEVLARLRPGVTIGAARAEALILAERLVSNAERRYQPLIRVTGFREQLVGDWQPLLLLLGGSVALVLLIACANIANLQLVRFAGRKREMAVRSTLGASRLRLMRQMLVEGAVLAGIGATVGVLIADATMKIVVASVPFYVPRLAEASINGSVLMFAMFVAAISTVLSCLIPAWGASKFDLAPALKQETGTGATHAGQLRLRGAFVLAEVALSTVVLAGAALVVRTFVVLRPSSPGFDPDGKLIFDMRALHADPAHANRQIPVFRDAIERLRAIPGVRSVAGVTYLPMSGMSNVPLIWIGGRLVAGMGTGLIVHYRASTTNFFQVMHMPIVSGRDLTSSDNEQAAKVAIVNQTTAARFWPGGRAVGQRLKVDVGGGNSVEFTVVGVVHDARIFGTVASYRPEMYVPFWQDPFTYMSFVVQAGSDPERLVPAVREALRPVGNSMIINGFDTMNHLLSDSIGEPRFNAQLFGTLAVLALLLALLGIYGVISYSVAQRTREIGIRMALGARPGEVVRSIVAQGLRLSLIGVGAGIAAALALTRVMSSLLFGVSSGGPLMFAGFLVALLGTTSLACYVPARRAMRVDPMVALRHE